MFSTQLYIISIFFIIIIITIIIIKSGAKGDEPGPG